MIPRDEQAVNIQNSLEKSTNNARGETPANLLDTALYYARCGWHIFPLRPADKTPLTSHGLHDATTDADTIRGWWGRWPDANIGLNCGASGLLAVDFDIHKEGYAGGALLKQLRAEHLTTTAQTGSGGFHLLYQQPAGNPLGNSRGRLPTGVDVRGVGGYIVTAPSLHPSGNRYTWEVFPAQMTPRPLPDFLLKMLEKPTQTPHTPNNGAQQSGNHGGRFSLAEDIATAQSNLARLATWRVDDRETWITVGMALAQLGDAGLPLWIGWSAQSSKFQPGECEAKWKGFVPGKGVTLATLTHWANEDDPTGARRPVFVDTSGAVELAEEQAKMTMNTDGGDPNAGDGAGQADGSCAAGGSGLDVYAYKPEDGGILDCWLDLNGNDWRYAPGLGWLVWADCYWSLSEVEIQAEIQNLIRVLNDLAEQKKRAAIKSNDKDAIAKASSYVSATKRTHSRITSVEKMAQAQRAICVDQLDGDGNLLNFLNCTFDLDTYTARLHSRNDLITHLLPYEYDPKATCPRWEQFCREVLVKEGTTQPDDELIALFQEGVGYALTTDTNREAMFWFPGDGGNGKTVAVTIISELLGSLAMTANLHTLADPGTYSLAKLPGKRLLFSTESERGQTIAEGLLKNIVSGERIQVRQIYEAPLEFHPVAKVFWAVNNLPVIKDTSSAIWRRLKPIPFFRSFADDEKDIHLIEKLRTELPGILNWAIAGLQRLRHNGDFTTAAGMVAVLQDLQIETNPMARWMQEQTTPAPTPVTPSKILYSDYKAWCSSNGHTAYNSTNFGREMKRLHVDWKRSNAGIVYALTL
ncbi:MAG: bifunctional DNA primase/polymerase [Caldilineaceae bacterium]|nr:bifunctional DNA primase/polymerase [Caldilineaceae bacterium]